VTFTHPRPLVVGDGAHVGADRSAKAITFGIENDSSDNQLIANAITSNNGKGIFIEGGSGNSMSQNVIHSNTVDGIRIDVRYDSYGAAIPGTGIGNSMVQNVVYNNGAKNINLGFDGGFRPNDNLDPDGGPNNGQNYPDLNPSATFYDSIANATTIGFALDTKAGDYLVEFFSNPMPGQPAGTTYLGNTIVSLAADGTVLGSFTLGGMHDNTSATATRVGPEKPAVMDTSEFSPLNPTFTLPVPGVSVSPSSLNFGDVVVGRSSGNSTITVTSQGTADYVVSALREDSCTGPAICTTGAFACSTTCTDGSHWYADQLVCRRGADNVADCYGRSQGPLGPTSWIVNLHRLN